MPIARYLEARRGYPRIGKLRKGAPKGEDGSCGPDLEWFRFTSDHPDKEAIEQVFLDKFGPEPDRIRVRLPHVTPGDCFGFWQEVWDHGGMIHRCDGNVCVQWRKEDGTYSNEPKPCPGGCTEVGRLDVIIPEMVEAGFVGPITVETHAKNDIPVIWGALQKAYEDQTDKYNGLRGIEFILYRSMESISTPPWKNDEPGKRRRRDASLVRIEPSAKWVQRQLEVFRAQAMGALENGKVPGLPLSSVSEEGTEPNGDGTNDGEVIEAKEVTVEKPKPKSKKGGNKSPHTAFWAAAKQVGMTRDDGLHLLAECKDDFTVALKRLVQEFPA